MKRFEGKYAVVIGGTHGMGLATATVLTDQGASVLVTGSNDANVASASAALGPSATVIRSDMSDTQDIKVLAHRIRDTFAPLDAVFVFAAVAEFDAFSQVSEAGYDRQFGINTRGLFFTLQHLAPLVRDGGSITVTTVTPSTASPGMAVYLGTKAAVRAFAQGLAAELLGRNVRVNALAPGFIDTPTLGLASLSTEERHAIHAIGNQATPMKRHGTVEEIAKAALFLGFDATFCTGIELPVDGGISTVDNP